MELCFCIHMQDTVSHFVSHLPYESVELLKDIIILIQEDVYVTDLMEWNGGNDFDLS